MIVPRIVEHRDKMKSERWKQIDKLFDDALEIEGEDERAAFLDARCADDAELRAEIESLLAASASALNHPNILTIHEIGQFGDSPFIASEYIAGETLRDRSNRSDKEPLTLGEIIDVAVQVAAALNAARYARLDTQRRTRTAR